MTETAPAAAGSTRRRPAPGAYNPAILFLAALIAFCLGILNGIFGVLDKVDEEPAKSLGYVLIWISITALVAAIAAIVIQIQKVLAERESREKATTSEQQAAEKAAYEQALREAKPLMLACMAAPVIPGAFAVVACVRIGLEIAEPSGWLAVFTGGFVP